METCSIEIAVQVTLLASVFFLFAVLVFPAALVALGSFLILHAVGDISAGLQWMGAWADNNWSLLAGTSGAVIFLASVIQLLWGYQRADCLRSTERQLRLTSGQAGQILDKVVLDLWRHLPRGDKSPPRILWFPNFNVMASASQNDTGPEIQVSSALWERAVRKDSVAVGILAHEMAHLLFSDIRTLRLTEAIVAASRSIARLVILTIVIVSVVLGTVLAVGHDNSYGDVALKEAAVLASMTLVLIIPTLATLTVRRQSALITALVEIRADACAGFWTSGLAGFARALAQDRQVKASSLGDVGHSLISPDLTHVSMSERITLLSDVTQLATPKLRYFALSLVLPFLFPLNPVTPLLEGGALDYFFIAFVVVALHFTTVAMIISGAIAMAAPLPWRKAVAIALFLCIATMLPRINLYEIGYLLSHFVAGLVLPGGFGADPLTLQSVGTDIVATLGSLWEKLRKASGGSQIMLAVIFSSVALRTLSLLARNMWLRSSGSSRIRLWIAPAIAAGIMAIVATYDEWRPFAFPLAADWSELTGEAPWIGLCAPELTALIIFAIQAIGVRFTDANAAFKTRA